MESPCCCPNHLLRRKGLRSREEEVSWHRCSQPPGSGDRWHMEAEEGTATAISTVTPRDRGACERLADTEPQKTAGEGDVAAALGREEQQGEHEGAQLHSEPGALPSPCQRPRRPGHPAGPARGQDLPPKAWKSNGSLGRLELPSRRLGYAGHRCPGKCF